MRIRWISHQRQLICCCKLKLKWRLVRSHFSAFGEILCTSQSMPTFVPLRGSKWTMFHLYSKCVEIRLSDFPLWALCLLCWPVIERKAWKMVKIKRYKIYNKEKKDFPPLSFGIVWFIRVNNHKSQCVIGDIAPKFGWTICL